MLLSEKTWKVQKTTKHYFPAAVQTVMLAKTVLTF